MIVLKSSRELELMKEACIISAQALQVAGEAVKPGISGKMGNIDGVPCLTIEHKTFGSQMQVQNQRVYLSELTDDFVKSEVEKLNDNKVNKANGIIKLVVKVIKSGKKWEIDNPSWNSGIVAIAVDSGGIYE